MMERKGCAYFKMWITCSDRSMYVYPMVRGGGGGAWSFHLTSFYGFIAVYKSLFFTPNDIEGG